MPRGNLWCLSAVLVSTLAFIKRSNGPQDRLYTHKISVWSQFDESFPIIQQVPTDFGKNICTPIWVKVWVKNNLNFCLTKKQQLRTWLTSNQTVKMQHAFKILLDGRLFLLLSCFCFHQRNATNVIHLGLEFWIENLLLEWIRNQRGKNLERISQFVNLV